MRLPNQAAPISRTSAAITRIAPQSCTGDCIMNYLGIYDCQKNGFDPSTFTGAAACAISKGVAYSPPSLIAAISGCGIKCAY